MKNNLLLRVFLLLCCWLTSSALLQSQTLYWGAGSLSDIGNINVLSNPSEFTYRDVIYQEGFECIDPTDYPITTSGPIPNISGWRYETDFDGGVGRLNVWGLTAGNGEGTLTVDNPNCDCSNALVWTVDLSAQAAATNLVLAHKYQSHGDEDDPQDRVEIRTSPTAPWIQIHDYDTGASVGIWTDIVVDLDAALQASGQTLSATTEIRFQQNDNFPYATDGASFDEIEIYLEGNATSTSYNTFDNDPSPLISGTTGGTFSSSQGLAIDSFTGEIDVSASEPGTYTVTYTVSGSSSDVSVTINPSADTAFSYSNTLYSTFDENEAPTITGLTGGEFTASPSGLNINSTTGEINFSASSPGDYVVTYKLLSPNCSVSSRNVSVYQPKVVTNVTSTTPDGTYDVSDVIDIVVEFDGTLDVDLTNGSPVLEMETGAVNRQAVYTGGDGTNQLTFTYTVQAGDNSRDLDYTSAVSLLDNGAVITESGTTLPARLVLPRTGFTGSLSANSAIMIQTDCSGFTYKSMIYQEDFECTDPADFPLRASANIPSLPEWRYETDYAPITGTAGRASLRNDFTPDGGNMLSMDNPDGESVNALILTLDLSAFASAKDLVLQHEWYDHGDEGDALDVVEIRTAPTEAWVEVYDYATNSNNGSWSTAIVDIDAALQAAGQTLSSTTEIRFQQNDNFPINTDGISIDKIEIYQTAETSSTNYNLTDNNPSPIYLGESGGTFSSSQGLAIDTASGVIDLSASTPGTYIITYTSPATCGLTSDVTVTINSALDSSFDYTQNLYSVSDSNPTPAISGTSGGSFSAATSGITLDPVTGEIDLQNTSPGTYDITYDIYVENCSSTTRSVTISPEFTYPFDTYIFTTGNANVDGLTALLSGGAGSSFKVYDSATGGNEITSGSNLLDDSTVFAAQIFNSIENINRITIEVNEICAPTQIVAPNATVADLVANPSSGYNTAWFTLNNGGIALSSTGALSSQTYYVEQGQSPTITTLGSGFSGPIGIAVDASGNILVADRSNDAIKRMDASGNNVQVLGSGFVRPAGVAVDANGNILVADTNNDAIKRMDSSGNNIQTLGSTFSRPRDIAIDASGNILVVDSGNDAIKSMDASGNNLQTLGSGFLFPFGITLDASGNILIADRSNNSIKRMDASGNNIQSLGSGFSEPFRVMVEANGNILLTDRSNDFIKRMDPSGINIENLGMGFSDPRGIAVEANGDILVADFGNNAIKRISLAPGSNRVPVQVTVQTELTVTGLTGDNKVYDGTTAATASGTPSLSGVQGGDNVSLSGTPVYTYASADVGTGITINTTGFTLTGADAANYTLAQPVLSADITAAGLTVTASDQDKFYGNMLTLDDTAFTITGFVNGETAASIGLGSPAFNSATGVDGSTTANAANYADEIVLSGLTSANYTFTYEAGDLLVFPRNIVVNINVNDKIYDGTTDATVDATNFTIIDLDGDAILPNGETIDSFSGSPSFATANVGMDIAVSGVVTPSGSNGFDIANYNAFFNLSDADITAAELTVTGLTGDNKIYDGTTAATASGTPSLTGVQVMDNVSLSGTPNYSFASADVGTGITIATTGWSLTGADAGNYTLAQPMLSADITAAGLTVTASDQDKFYGNMITLDDTAFTITGFVNGETAASIGLGTPIFNSSTGVDTSTTANATNYADEIVLSGLTAANYSFTYEAGDLLVLPRDITINLNTNDKVYDGTTTATVSPSSFTVVDLDGDAILPNGETIDSVVGVFDFVSAEVGTNISVTGNSTGITGSNGFNIANYNAGALPSNADITAAELTVTGLTGNDKLFDGTTDATASGTAALAGVFGADDVLLAGTPVFTFAQSSPGTDIVITTTGYTLSGADSGNYSLTQPVLMADITTAPLTAPTVDALTTGDQTPVITGTTGTGQGLLAGQTLTVTLNGATYNVIPDASGNWSLDTETATPDNGTLGMFSDGDFEIIATVSDVTGASLSDATNLELTFDSTLSIDNFSLEATLKIYPNPTKGILNVTLSGDRINKLTLMDMAGKIVMKAQHSSQLDLSNLQQGVYLIKVDTDSGSAVKRVIKK